MIKKYRKKSVIIEAIQWKSIAKGKSNAYEIYDFIGKAYGGGLDGEGIYLYIKTKEGKMKARLNDWIVRDIKGEFYPCKPYMFKKTYEEIK